MNYNGQITCTYLYSHYVLAVFVYQCVLHSYTYILIMHIICMFAGVAYGVGGAQFGRGSGLIFLDNVECTGDEPSLLECRSQDIGQHNCDRSEDAGVFCPSESGVLPLAYVSLYSI